RVGKGFGTEVDSEPAVRAGGDPASERLAERSRRFRDLLEEVVGGGPAVDVARGDLGVLQLVGRYRQLGAVVRRAADAGELAGGPRVEGHDLAPGGAGPLRVGRRLAVHAQVGGGLLDEPV